MNRGNWNRGGRGFRGGGSFNEINSANNSFAQMDEIQVLDRELELLKKKRELMEMQKAVQSLQPYQNNYNGGATVSNQYGSNSGQSGPPNQGRKRPNFDPTWLPKSPKMAKQEPSNSSKYQNVFDPKYVIKKLAPLPPAIMNHLKMVAETIFKNMQNSECLNKKVLRSVHVVLVKLITARLYDLLTDSAVGYRHRAISLYEKAYPSKLDQETLSLALSIMEKGYIHYKSQEEELMTYLKLQIKFKTMSNELTNYIINHSGSVLAKNLDVMFEKMFNNYNALEPNEKAEEKIVESGILNEFSSDGPQLALSKYNDIIEYSIKQKLPLIMKRNKRKIIHILQTIDLKGQDKKEPVKKTQETTVHNTQFVIVKAMPLLPNKEQLKEFLQSFKPDSIKKHKDIDNVIFVGFKDNSSYQDILGADGTVIDNIPLIIKPSKGLNDSLNNKAYTENADKVENKTSTEKTSDDSCIIIEEPTYPPITIDEDLDGQISNLLQSIREAENNQSESSSLNNFNQSDAKGEDVEENVGTNVAEEEKEENSNGNKQSQQSELDGHEEGNNDEELDQQASKVQDNNVDETKDLVDDTKNEGDEAKNVGDETKNVGDEAKNVGDEIKNVGDEIKNVGDEAKNVGDEAKNVGDEAKNEGDETKNVGDEAKNVGDEAKNVGDEIKSVGDEAKNVGDEAKNVGDEVKNEGDETKNVGDEAKNVGDETKNVGDEAKNVGDEAKNVGDETKNVGDEAKTERDEVKTVEDPKIQTRRSSRLKQT